MVISIGKFLIHLNQQKQIVKHYNTFWQARRCNLAITVALIIAIGQRIIPNRYIDVKRQC